MSADPAPPPAEPHAADRSWGLWAGGFVGAFVLVSLILALIVLPARSKGKFDPFTAICRALGIPGYEKVPPDPGAATASAPVSNVVWTVETLHRLSDASAARGAVLAKGTCAFCHGVDGKSVNPTQFPDLAGQSEAAIFKELSDFQFGDRKSVTMQPIAQLLTDEQIADVASYYATRPSVDVRLADSIPSTGEWIRTFAVITTDANELVAEIHDRMPLILGPGDYARWLSDDPDPRELMRPFPADPMRMWPISTRVNKPENDDPSIIEPIESATSVV